MTHYCRLLLLLAVLPAVSQARPRSDCPVPGDLRPCVCTSEHGAVYVTCENTGQSQVRAVLSALARWRGTVERLTLRHNRLPALSNRLFNGVSVFRLELDENDVDMVDRGAFHGLERSLTHLLLREPAAEKFAFDAFDDLHVLESLHIERTPLQTMPALARADRLRLLRINGTGITQIAERSFRGAPELRELHFTHNPTTALGEDALLGLGMLRVANFSANRIGYIHPRAFRPTRQLDHLSLSGNGLKDATVATLAAREAPRLRRLDLSMNLIEYVKTGTFVDLKKLEILDLRQNLISKVDKDAFHVLPQLKRLDLTNNYVSSLEKEAFFSMGSLEQLLLKNNNISSLAGCADVLKKLPKLRILDVSKNLIETVPDNTFSHPSLEIIYLNHNNIKELTPASFSKMPGLREMHLHHNFLALGPASSGVWWDLPKLTLLDLRYNDLTQLPASVLRNVSRLEHADFSFNLISQIDENAFEGTPILKYLNISYNSLLSVNPMTFKNLQLLRQLDLSYNELASLQTGLFANLDHLEDLRLKFNKISVIHTGSMPTHESLRAFDISYNFIDAFPSFALTELRGLTELRMKQNMFREVPAEALQKLTKMKDLDFGFNLLSKLDPNMLRTMTNLRSVELSGNFLKTIPLGLFENNGELRVVNISNNLLSTIPPKTFHNLDRLETLDLRNNTLTEFDNVVNELPSLKYLDASFNNIQLLSSTTFENTPSLEHLEMNHNYVERIKSNTFLNMPSLRHLDLSFNALTEMDPGSFRGDQQLVTMSLNNNALRELKEATFVNLNRLERLDLQENQLTKLGGNAYQNLPALREYNLSSNQLKHLSRASFQSLPGLQRIDLGHNRILEVTDGVFRPLTNLRMVKLNDNGMCRIHEDAFAGQRQMDTVHLQNNRLRFLRKPLFRRVRSRMRHLEVSGNPLKCDCEIQWLRDWLGDLRARHPPTARLLREPICFYPQAMRGIPMLRTRENEFSCERASVDDEEPCPEFTDAELRVFQPIQRPAGSRNPHQLGGYEAAADYNGLHDTPHDSVNEITDQSGSTPPAPTTSERNGAAETTAQIAAPTATTPLSAADPNYTAGDTPTIYVGSVKKQEVQKQTDAKDGGGGMSALGAGLASAGGLLGTLGTLGTLGSLLPKLGLTFGLGNSNRNSDRKGQVAPGSLPPGMDRHRGPARPPFAGHNKQYPNQQRRPDFYSQRGRPAGALLLPGGRPENQRTPPGGAPSMPEQSGTRYRQPPGSAQRQPPGSGQRQQPGSGQRQQPGSGQRQQPGSGQRQQPGSGQRQQPGSGQRQPPGSGQRQQPGSGQRQQPGSGQRQQPGSGQRQQPGSGQRQQPGSGQRQQPGSGQRQPPGSGQPPISPDQLFIPAKHGHIRYNDEADPFDLNAFVFPDPKLNPGAASTRDTVVFDGEEAAPAPRPPTAPETIPMDAPFVPSPSFDTEPQDMTGFRPLSDAAQTPAAAPGGGSKFGLQDVWSERSAPAAGSATGLASLEAEQDAEISLDRLMDEIRQLEEAAGERPSSTERARPSSTTEAAREPSTEMTSYPSDDLADYSLDRLLSMIAGQTTPGSADEPDGGTGFSDFTSTPAPPPPAPEREREETEREEEIAETAETRRDDTLSAWFDSTAPDTVEHTEYPSTSTTERNAAATTEWATETTSQWSDISDRRASTGWPVEALDVAPEEHHLTEHPPVENERRDPVENERRDPVESERRDPVESQSHTDAPTQTDVLPNDDDLSDVLANAFSNTLSDWLSDEPGAETTAQSPSAEETHTETATETQASVPELDTVPTDHGWGPPKNATYEARLKAELAVHKHKEEAPPPRTTPAPPPPPVGPPAVPRVRSSITKVQAYDNQYDLPQFIAPNDGGLASHAAARPQPLEPEPALAPESNTIPFGDSLSQQPALGRAQPASDTTNEWYYKNYFTEELEVSRPADQWPPYRAAVSGGGSSGVGGPRPALWSLLGALLVAVAAARTVAC